MVEIIVYINDSLVQRLQIIQIVESKALNVETWNLLLCPGLQLQLEVNSFTAILDSESTRVGQGGTILTSTKLKGVFHSNWLVPFCMK